MMKNMNKYKTVFAAAFLALVSCNSIYGGAENTSGTESISAVPEALDFSGSVGDTTYRTLTFSNYSTENYLIDNMAFVDNVCGDFSIYNVIDSSGNVLYSYGDDIAISVASGQTANINIKFSPAECETDNYTATFIIFYQKGTSRSSMAAELHASVEQPQASGNEVECPEDTTVKTYNDALGDPTVSRSVPAGDYYLRIDRIRSYIQPTAGFSSYAIKVGTDISLDQIDDENEFQPIYLPISSDGNGNLSLKDVDACAGFKLPTPITDTNLRGATAILTITGSNDSGVSTGTIDNGLVNFENVNAYLTAHIANTQSLIQDEATGDFSITIEMDLTSGISEANSYLDSIAELTDDEGDEFLNINANGEDSTLQGSSLRHGSVRIVGVGVFNGDNFVGSQIAHQALIENTSYIFIQIDGYVTTLKSEDSL